MSSIVSSITGGVSGNRGGAGLNYSADGAQILSPTTEQQANDQYGTVQMGLDQQAAFLNAVQGQNGLGNQSSVFNQMQGVANGTGPNPAQAMLANSTGQNVANQAAMMAGQRGAGANVGLMARQASQQGANIQQQAAGQGAAMQANQSLNALNQMGGLATNQANQQANATNAYTNAGLGAQSNILGGIAAQNNAHVGMQSNINSANAGISAIAAQQQGNLIGNITGGVGAALGLAEGGQVPAYEDGGIIDTIKSAFTEDAPKGGNAHPLDPDKVKGFTSNFADGGVTELQPIQGPASGPQSNIGKFLSQSLNTGSPGAQSPAPMALAGQAIGSGIGQGLKSLGGLFSKSSNPSDKVNDTDLLDTMSSGSAGAYGALGEGQSIAGDVAPMMLAAAKGGKVPAMVSPGEQYLSPKEVKKVKKGANPLKVGERIPGKPKYKGDDYRNDTVPRKLEEGGIVIPNHVMQSPHPQWAAHKFVASIMKEQSLKKGK